MFISTPWSPCKQLAVEIRQRGSGASQSALQKVSLAVLKLVQWAIRPRQLQRRIHVTCSAAFILPKTHTTSRRQLQRRHQRPPPPWLALFMLLATTAAMLAQPLRQVPLACPPPPAPSASCSSPPRRRRCLACPPATRPLRILLLACDGAAWRCRVRSKLTTRARAPACAQAEEREMGAAYLVKSQVWSAGPEGALASGRVCWPASERVLLVAQPPDTWRAFVLARARTPSLRSSPARSRSARGRSGAGRASRTAASARSAGSVRLVARHLQSKPAGTASARYQVPRRGRVRNCFCGNALADVPPSLPVAGRTARRFPGMAGAAQHAAAAAGRGQHR